MSLILFQNHFWQQPELMAAIKIENEADLEILLNKTYLKESASRIE